MADDLLLPLVLGMTALGSVALVGISLIALFRRQSFSYFLVTLAIGTFLLRSFLGAVMLRGLVSVHAHHFLEHVLDAVLIGLLFAAVYAARRLEVQPTISERSQEYNG